MHLEPSANNVGKGDVWDEVFLVGVVALAALPYVAGLGFYSDDYRFLATMSQADPQCLWAIVENLLVSPDLAVRPVQVAYLAVLYKIFGLSPLPGHIINHIVFGAGILLFYACLRRLGVPRFYCVALPLMFASLPHYSTVRFWLATYQITLSMLLFFATFYCSLRFAEGANLKRWSWLAAASLAMLLSLMAYEIFMPLFLLIPLMAWLPRVLYFEPKPRLYPSRVAWPRLFIVHFLSYCMVGLAVFLLKMELRGEHPVWQGTFDEWIWLMSWLIKGVVTTAFLEHGLKLPVNAATLLQDYWRLEAVLIALASFAAIFGYLSSLKRHWFNEWLILKTAALAGLGLLIFVGGYAVFVNSFRIGFSPTGIANRVSMAASLGFSVIALSIVVLIEGWLKGRLARLFAPLAISIGCSAGILINATLGILWAEAAQVQRHLLAQLRSDIPALPGATTLLLDGFCPFVGPGPVFESSWDLKGALQMLYGNPLISADVIKPNVLIGKSAITTTIYRESNHYPYGRLLIYNVREQRAWLLEDLQAALDYFARFDPAKSAGCRFEDGGGVSVY